MVPPPQHTLSSADIEARIDTLPTLPAVVTEIIGLDPASDAFHLKLRQLALHDPPLAVRVIAVANSATYASVTPVLSLQEALMRLGSRQVAHFVTSVSVMRVFVPRSEGHRNLWRHSIQVAVAARTIAASSLRGVEPQQAYVVGLLHDIGRFVMFEHDPLDFEAVEGTHWTTPSDLLDAEREVCGFDHADLGWRAAKRWRLPDVLADAIRLHHATRFDTSVPLPFERLVRVVQLADALSCVLLNQNRFAALDSTTRRKLVEPICAAASSPAVGEFSVADVAGLAGPIQDESATLAAALGIHPVDSPVDCRPKTA